MKEFIAIWDVDVKKTIEKHCTGVSEEQVLKAIKTSSEVQTRLNPEMSNPRNHKVIEITDEFSFQNFVEFTKWNNIKDTRDAAEKAFKFCQEYYLTKMLKEKEVTPINVFELFSRYEPNHIIIWHPESCPKEVLATFTNHDDMDAIAFVPDSLCDRYFPFLEHPHFGCCDVEEHKVPGGKIVVGYHS